MPRIPTSLGRGLSTPSATSRGEMGVTGSELGAATMVVRVQESTRKWKREGGRVEVRERKEDGGYIYFL